MRLYRIYTESKPNLVKIVSKHTKNFTMLTGIGYWDGISEDCAVIEILAKGEIIIPHLIAQEIKQVNNQESVLVIQHEIGGCFI